MFWNYNIYKLRSTPFNVIEDIIALRNREQKEKELKGVLVGILVIFVFCHGLNTFDSIYATFAKKDFLRCYLQREMD